MMEYAQDQEDGSNSFCVAWRADGASVVIRHPKTFTRDVIPRFFKPCRFESFTRKLYRWGFKFLRRGVGLDDPVVLKSEYFVRHDPGLMSKMQSETAAKDRSRAKGIQKGVAEDSHGNANKECERYSWRLRDRHHVSERVLNTWEADLKMPADEHAKRVYDQVATAHAMDRANCPQEWNSSSNERTSSNSRGKVKRSRFIGQDDMDQQNRCPQLEDNTTNLHGYAFK